MLRCAAQAQPPLTVLGAGGKDASHSSYTKQRLRGYDGAQSVDTEANPADSARQRPGRGVRPGVRVMSHWWWCCFLDAIASARLSAQHCACISRYSSPCCVRRDQRSRPAPAVAPLGLSPGCPRTLACRLQSPVACTCARTAESASTDTFRECRQRSILAGQPARAPRLRTTVPVAATALLQGHMASRTARLTAAREVRPAAAALLPLAVQRATSGLPSRRTSQCSSAWR
jgi:hypothetical protein